MSRNPLLAWSLITLWCCGCGGDPEAEVLPVTGLVAAAGDSGNKVYQMFTTFQATPLSGWGARRMVRVDPLAGEVAVSTHGTLNSKYIPIDTHQFKYSGVELGPVR